MGADRGRQAAKERPGHTSKPRANQVHARHNAEYFEPVGVCDAHEGVPSYCDVRTASAAG
jgi:hypothetical protein